MYNYEQWAEQIIDKMGMPEIIISMVVIQNAVKNGIPIGEIKADIKLKMSEIGYEIFKNPNAKDGRWKAYGIPYTIYKNKAAIIVLDKFDIYSFINGEYYYV